MRTNLLLIRSDRDDQHANKYRHGEPSVIEYFLECRAIIVVYQSMQAVLSMALNFQKESRYSLQRLEYAAVD